MREGKARGLSIRQSLMNVFAVQVSPSAFRSILDFYRNGVIRCPPNISAAELNEACQFFLIPFDHKSIKCENLGTFLHELSNDGAREQV